MGVFAELEPVTLVVAGVTGGVDDPSREGIEIDDSEDVDETGDGMAVTLFDKPLLGTVFVLELGASKFVIVGECFLLDPLLFVPGVCADGADCLALGAEATVDVLVHVVGILLATGGAADDDLPFVMAEPAGAPLPTWFGNDVKCVLSGSFAS